MHILRVVVLNLALSALVIALATLALWADRWWPFALPGWLVPLAWPLLILGALLILAAEYTLLTQGGATGAPGDHTRRLVTGGPYRFMRNPIYAGEAALLLAVAFFARSPSFLALAIAFSITIHLFVRLVEEPHARRRFGQAYFDYQRRVPRWAPRLPEPARPGGDHI